MTQRDDSEEETLPGFSQMMSRLQRARAATLPPLPHDIDIAGEWGRTWRGQPFLSHLDIDWGFAIFSSEANVRILQRCETYIDGSLNTCPSPYTQYVTVHGKYIGEVFILAICLLDDKTVGQYRQKLQRPVALILAIKTELPYVPATPTSAKAFGLKCRA